MGNKNSNKTKRNKDHFKQKSLKVGLSFGKEAINIEGNAQIGYVSVNKKRYDDTNQ